MAGYGILKWASFAVLLLGLVFALVWGVRQYYPGWADSIGEKISPGTTVQSQGQ